MGYWITNKRQGIRDKGREKEIIYDLKWIRHKG